MSLNDEKLIKNCLKGKPDAQRELYEGYAPLMLGVCFRYTKNMADAENILQDGFVKVFHHLHSFRKEGELGAWIRRIMVNTSLTYLKTNSRYSHEMIFEESHLHTVSDEDPADTLDTKELAKLIRQLPTGYQTIFNLHAVEGYSHVEIAAILGISDGTSRSQYARARALLIRWLHNHAKQEKGGVYGK